MSKTKKEKYCVICGEKILDHRANICKKCFEKARMIMDARESDNGIPQLRKPQEIEKEIAKIGAQISPFQTNEKWVDCNGKIYNVDRNPIKWDKIFRKV